MTRQHRQDAAVEPLTFSSSAKEQVAAWCGVLQARVRGVPVLQVTGAARPDGTRNTSGTRFQAGSIGKTVMGVVALRLVEESVLDLHRPLRGWLPDTSDPLADVTVHQLLTHTSGLGHWSDLPGIDIADPPSPEELLGRAATMPLPHQPQTWHYSVLGYLLLAKLIETATGRTYGDIAQTLVFEPARMSSSSSGVVPANFGWAVGQHDSVWIEVSDAPTALPGTGDLWSTTGDLLALESALQEGRLLSKDMLALMQHPHVSLPESVPLVGNQVRADGYGYGTWLGSAFGGPAVIRPGDNVGYRSLALHRLDGSLDLAVLSNNDAVALTAPLKALVQR